MNPKEQLIKEIAQAPDALIEEVVDFLSFVKTRRFQSAIAKSHLNREVDYEKIFRAKGLPRDRRANLLTYASQIRQESE